MAEQRTKLQTYTQMAADKSAVITSSFDNWASFLTTTAKFYKYTFLEQLMIYIQRPQATACAEYSVWRNRMRRYVRRNAKGIAVISFVKGQPALRYVFDIADTGPREDALSPFLWQNKDEYQSIIPAALEERFSVPLDHRGLPIQLASIAARLAEKFWTSGQEQIISSIGSGLPDNPSETFLDAAAASITYALLSRCDLHPNQFFSDEDFASVYKFNAFRSVMALGTAVSKSSALVLRCIETAIKQYEQDKSTGRLTETIQPAPLITVPVSPPEPEQRQIEDFSEVLDVETPGTSVIPPQEEEEQDSQQKISTTPLALTPGQPLAGNFRITDDHLGKGGPKTKFRMNMDAIAVLNHIEADGRTATLEEQETLSRYVGWGGIPDVFDSDKTEWAAEYQKLKSLLSDDEYASAQSSTLNAHYTS